jgi:hypothetical protein
MRVIRNLYNILIGEPERRDHLENIGVKGKIILEWIFEKQDGRVWIGLMWLRIERSL